MKKILPSCATCGISTIEKACIVENGKGLKSCPTLTLTELAEEQQKQYQDPEIHEFARQASIQEAECYEGREQSPYVPHCTKTRIQEVCEFAHKVGVHRMGLAFCAGLIPEAKAVDAIFKAQGFEVVSVICKVGRMSKETELGLTDQEKIMIGTDEAACNPILQAGVLNEAGTDLNVLLGLCVGHDSLFMKHAEAYTTVLAVKDRVTGHNPLSAIYNANWYHMYLHKPGFDLQATF